MRGIKTLFTTKLQRFFAEEKLVELTSWMLLEVLYGCPDITSGKYAEHDFEIIPIQTTTEIFKASLLNII